MNQKENELNNLINSFLTDERLASRWGTKCSTPRNTSFLLNQRMSY